MEYNKKQFIKSNDKKVLHKVRKQWVVLSLSMLALLGGGVAAEHVSAHADTTNNEHNNASVTDTLKARINSNLIKMQSANSQQTRLNQNNQSNLVAINQQANALHNRILMNATQNGANQARSENDNTDTSRKTDNNKTSVSTQQIPSHQSSLSDQIEQPNTKNYVQGKAGNQSVKNNQSLKQMVVNQPMVGSASGTFEGLNYTSDGAGTVTFTGKFPNSSISDFFSNGAYGGLPSNPVTNARKVIFGSNTTPVDFSNVTSLTNMFNDSKNFNINEIDFNNVTYMSHVTSMSQMFGSNENHNLNVIVLGKGFDMSGVTNDSSMLANTYEPISNKGNVLVTSKRTFNNLKPDIQNEVTMAPTQKMTGTYQGLNYTYYPDTRTTEFTGGVLNWSDGSNSIGGVGNHDFITPNVNTNTNKSNNQSSDSDNHSCPAWIDASEHIKFDNGVKIPQVTTGSSSGGNGHLRYFIADDPIVESIEFGSDLANYKVFAENDTKSQNMFASDINLRELTIPNGWFTQYDASDTQNSNVLVSDRSLSKLKILPSPSAYNEYTTSISSKRASLPRTSPLYKIILDKPLLPGVYTATPQVYYKTYKGLNYTYNPGTKTVEFISGTPKWSNPGGDYHKALIGGQTNAPSDLQTAKTIKFDIDITASNDKQPIGGLIQDDPNVTKIDLGPNFAENMLENAGANAVNGMFASDDNVKEIDMPYDIVNSWNPSSMFSSDKNLSKLVIYNNKVSGLPPMNFGNPGYSTVISSTKWYSISDKKKSNPIQLADSSNSKGNNSKFNITSGIYVTDPNSNENKHQGTYDDLNYIYDPSTSTAEFTSGTLNWSNTSAGYPSALIGNQTSAPSDLKKAHHIKFDSDVNTGAVSQPYSGLIQDDPNVQSVDLGKNFASAMLVKEGGNSLNGMFMSDYNLQEIDIPYKLMNSSNPTGSFVESDNKLSKIVIYSDNANPYYNSQEFTSQTDNNGFNGTWYSINDKQKSNPIHFTSENVKPGIYVINPNNPLNLDYTHEGTAHVDIDSSNDTITVSNGTLVPGKHEFISDIRNNNGNLLNSDSLLGNDKKDWKIQFNNVTAPSDMAFVLSGGKNTTTTQNALGNQVSTIDLSGLDMSHVTNMEGMMINSNNLQHVIFGDNTDTSNVTNMDMMLGSDSSLETVDLSNLSGKNLQQAWDLFDNDNQLKSVTLGSKLSPQGNEHVNLGEMFADDQSLPFSGIRWKGFNTKYVSQFYGMFRNDNVLGDVTLPNSFDTSHGINFGTSPSPNKYSDDGSDGMFQSDYSTHKIDLSEPNFNTSNVTSMQEMFGADKQLSDINFGNHFYTGNVTNMKRMFAYSDGFTNLTLPNTFDTSKVFDNTGMFESDTRPLDGKPDSGKLRSITITSPNTILDKGRAGVDGDTFLGAEHPKFYQTNPDKTTVSTPYDFTKSNPNASESNPKLVTQNQIIKAVVNYQYQNGSGKHLEGQNTLTGSPSDSVTFTSGEQSTNAKELNPGWQVASAKNVKYSDFSTEAPSDVTVPADPYDETVGYLDVPVTPDTYNETVHYVVSDNSNYAKHGQTLNSYSDTLADDRAADASDTSLTNDSSSIQQNMPTGYHVNGSFTFKHQSGQPHLDKVNIAPNSETETVNYIYHDDSGDHKVSSDTIDFRGYYDNISDVNKSRDPGLNHKYELKNPRTSFTYGQNNNMVNVPVKKLQDKEVSVTYFNEETQQKINNDTTSIGFPYNSDGQISPTEQISRSDLESQNGFPSGGYEVYPPSQQSVTINSNGQTVIPVAKQHVVATGNWDASDKGSARFAIVSDQQPSNPVNHQFTPNNSDNTLVFISSGPLNVNSWSKAGTLDSNGNIISHTFSDDGNSAYPNALNRNSIKHIMLNPGVTVTLPAGTTDEGIKSDTGLFQSMHNLSDITLGTNAKIDASQAQNLSSMFANDENIKRINLSDWNASNVTVTSDMFAGDTALSDLTLPNSGFGTLTDIAGMFSSDHSLKGNTGGANDSTYNPNDTSDIKNIKRMNVSQVSDMASTFESDYNLRGLNLSGWFNDAKSNNLSDMDAMFANDPKLLYLNIQGLSNPNMIIGGANSDFQSDFTDPKNNNYRVDMNQNLHLGSDSLLGGYWGATSDDYNRYHSSNGSQYPVNYLSDPNLFSPRQINQDGANLGPNLTTTWQKIANNQNDLNTKTEKVDLYNQADDYIGTRTISVPKKDSNGNYLVDVSDQLRGQSMPAGYRLPPKNGHLSDIVNGYLIKTISDTNVQYSDYNHHPKAYLLGYSDNQTLPVTVEYDDDPSGSANKTQHHYTIQVSGYYGDTNDSIPADDWQPGPGTSYQFDPHKSSDVYEGQVYYNMLNSDNGYQPNSNAKWNIQKGTSSLNPPQPLLYYDDKASTILKVVYVNQSGRQIGDSDNISGPEGEIVNVTDPSDNGIQIPNGYSLIGGATNVKGNNDDAGVYGTTQDTVYTLNGKQKTVYLHLQGNPSADASVEVHLVITDANGHTFTSSKSVRLSDIDGHQANDGDIVELNPSDGHIRPSDKDSHHNYIYVPDYSKDSVQFAQVDEGSNGKVKVDPADVTFYYRSATTTGAPVAIRYVASDGNGHDHEVGSIKVLQGNIGDTVKVDKTAVDSQKITLPKGYSLTSDQESDDSTFTDSPQIMDVKVQGNQYSSDDPFVITRKYSDNGSKTDQYKVYLHNARVGDSFTVSPYGFSDGGVINKISDSSDGSQPKYTVPPNNHATTSDADLTVYINSDDQLSQSNTTYNYQSNNVDQTQTSKITIHYVTSDASMKNMNSDGISVPSQVGNNYHELDEESDIGTNKDQFDLKPYTDDIPEFVSVSKYYNGVDAVSSNDVINGSTYQPIDPSDYRWTFGQANEPTDIYIKVHDNGNNGDQPIIID